MSKKNQQNNVLPKKLTVLEVIDYCKNELGIEFNLMNEADAKVFLEKHNYFFRLKQYAQTCNNQTKSGKYIGLDFGHLVELSTVDMFLRKILLKMTIDLEHNLKVKLVNDCQNNPADDGYMVVTKFLETNMRAKEEVEANAKPANYGAINFSRYGETPAVWNIVEMLNFYEFISFYSFYYDYFRQKCEYTKHFDAVRRIRNAAAHNACMLCSFKPVQTFSYDVEISFEMLSAKLGVGSGTIQNCLKVPLLNDFAVMLKLYTTLISSPKVKQKTLEELTDFFDTRMILHKDYFESNSEIKNAYQFARKVLEYYSKK